MRNDKIKSHKSMTKRLNSHSDGSLNRSKGTEVTGQLSEEPQTTEKSIHTDTLQSYLAGIGKYKLLSRDEERKLIRRVRIHGDRQASQTIITSNLRLVVKIALDYKRVWMQNLMDLIQEGNIGLIKAVEKFDPEKNVKFSYYASFWIKAYIIKHLMDNWRLVKIGTTQAQRKLFFRLKKEKQKLAIVHAMIIVFVLTFLKTL